MIFGVRASGDYDDGGGEPRWPGWIIAALFMTAAIGIIAFMAVRGVGHWLGVWP